MCSLIIYLSCAPLEPQFKLEIKMIWNWLLRLFTNEQLFSISFELLKEMSGDANEEWPVNDAEEAATVNKSSTSNGMPTSNESSPNDVSLLTSPSEQDFNSDDCSPLNGSPHQSTFRCLLPDLQSSCFASSPQYNQPHSKQLHLNEINVSDSISGVFDWQDELKCKEPAKLSKLNSNSLPDLVPEEERRQLALKEIGIKLRHISESFERSRKR